MRTRPCPADPRSHRPFGARPSLLVLPALLAAGAGCAAPSKPSAPAAEAAAPSLEGTPSPAPASPLQAPQLPAGDAGGAQGELTDPASALERAERDLDAALGSLAATPQSTSLATDECTTACRALGSMQRAASRLCELDTPREGERCAHAKARVARAEERVRSRCASCASLP
jgi:hypothetical protein